MVNHQCKVEAGPEQQLPPNSLSSRRTCQQREKGQRQRHVSGLTASAASTDKRLINPSAVSSTAAMAVSASVASEAGIASGDLWQLQNKFHTKDFEQDHPAAFQESLVAIRSNSGNYTRLPLQNQSSQLPRPNSQHIYVDLDSSTSSFSSMSAGAAAESETPSTGETITQQCHTPRSYVVSQC